MIFPRQLRKAGGQPAVVATIHTLPGLKAALKLPAGAVDFFELRLDTLAAGQDRLSRLLPKLKAPLMLTVRHPLEGGAGRMPLEKRRRLYEQFLPHAACIDIEIRSLRALAGVIRAARARKVGVIISHHDFQKTPPVAKLSALARRASRAGADIFKIATRTSSLADLAVLLSFMARQKGRKVSVMGMGRFGKISRLLFADAGSVLNYGYLDTPQVTGQWSALILKLRRSEIFETRPPARGH